MPARQTLADNIRALMEASATIKSTPKLQAATEKLGRKVSDSTLSRTLNCETPLNIDLVEVVAQAYGLDAWQLLVPSLDPNRPPVLRSIGTTEDELYRKIGSLLAEATKASRTE